MVVSFTTLVHFMIHFCPPPYSLFWGVVVLLHAHVRMYVPLVKNLIRNSTRIILATGYSTSIYSKAAKLQKSVALFKMASGKKSVKSKGAAKKWLC